MSVEFDSTYKIEHVYIPGGSWGIWTVTIEHGAEDESHGHVVKTFDGESGRAEALAFLTTAVEAHMEFGEARV
jgi:hypothetical protein